MKGREVEDELLRVLGFEWQGRSSQSLVEELGRPKTTVRDALMRLYREGKVERADTGQWFLACTDRVVLDEPDPEPEEAEVVTAPMPELEEEALSRVTFVPTQELEREPEKTAREKFDEDMARRGWIRKPEEPAQKLPHNPMLEALERLVDDSHVEPEVTLKFKVPTWVARRVMETLEQCSREGRGEA